MVASGQFGDVLLMSTVPGPASSRGTSAYPSGISARQPGEAMLHTTDGDVPQAHLPPDWGLCTQATSLQHFCGLPVRVGSELRAVITLAWAASCAVPPGLRPVPSSGGAAAGGVTFGASGGERPHPGSGPAAVKAGFGAVVPVGAAEDGAAARAATGLPGVSEYQTGQQQQQQQQHWAAAAWAAPPTEAERSCLTQLAQVFSLALFADPACAVYGSRIAEILHCVTCGVTLQNIFDDITAGVRDALFQRHHIDLACTLALAHPSIPTAAFIVEGRDGPSFPAPASAPVASRASMHNKGQTSNGPQRSGSVCNASRTAGSTAAAGSATSLLSPFTYKPSTQGTPAATGRLISGAGAAAGCPKGPTPMPGGASLGGTGMSGPSHSIPSRPALSSISHSHNRLRCVEGRALPPRGIGAVSGGGNFVGTMSMELSCVPSQPYDTPDCEPAATVHVHVTALGHTLLLASLAVHVDAGEPPVAAPSAAPSELRGRPLVTQDVTLLGMSHGSAYGASSSAGAGAGGSNRVGSGAGAGPVAVGSPLHASAQAAAGMGISSGSGGHVLSKLVQAGVNAQGCIVANCLLHMQDESLPCRDIVLVQKLTRAPVQSAVLVLVRAQGGTCTGFGNSPSAGAAFEFTPPGGVGMLTPAGVIAAAMAASPGIASAAVLNDLGLSIRPTAASGVPGPPPLPTLALYLTSADPLPKSVLAVAQKEAREILKLAAGLLCMRLVHGPVGEQWMSLLEVLSAPAQAAAGGISFGSTRMVSLTRPRSSTMLQPQVSCELYPCNSITSLHSRSQLQGLLSGELSKPLAATSARLVVDSSVEQPLQQLDAMVSSIQSTLSSVMQMQQLDEPGTEIRLNDIAAVELMEIIGRGGQGVVFRGIVHGIEAAVKVISHKDELDDGAHKPADEPRIGHAPAAVSAAGGHEPRALDSPVVDEARLRDRKRSLLRDALELAVTSTISHPNIVQMYGYFTDCVVVQYAQQSNRLKLLPADSEALQPYGSQRGPVNTVLCMEYCDAGTLKSVAEAGSFRQRGVSAKSGPACPALVPLYTSLLEVALSLRHLHSRRLVHCDLKPSNVLLKSSRRDPRGWTCKLSDFGCVRVMSEETADGRPAFRQPQPLGTLTHMAPEMFARGGLLDATVDVYAFGIIMWELIMVAPLYDGMAPKDKLPSLIRRGLRPVFHPLVPPEYRMLASACWLDDPRRRPSAAVLVSTVQRLLRLAQATPAPGALPPASTSASKTISPAPLGTLHQGAHSALPSMQSAAGPPPLPPAAAAAAAPADPDGGAASATARSGIQASSHNSKALPRRNIISTNLASQGAGGGGSGGGSAGPAAAGTIVVGSTSAAQRQSFQAVSSPLSREAGPSARAAIRVGDSGAGPRSLRLHDSAQLLSPGGSLAGGAAGAVSPLNTGLGPVAGERAAGNVLVGSNVAADWAAAAARDVSGASKKYCGGAVSTADAAEGPPKQSESPRADPRDVRPGTGDVGLGMGAVGGGSEGEGEGEPGVGDGLPGNAFASGCVGPFSISPALTAGTEDIRNQR